MVPEKLEQDKETRKILIQKITPSKKAQQTTVPGIPNIAKEMKSQQQIQKQKESEATMVIQKWTRGFLARHLVREVRESKRSRIEGEYGYFEDQVKFSSDYNL